MTKTTEKTARAPKATTRKTAEKPATKAKPRASAKKNGNGALAVKPVEDVRTEALLARATSWTLFVRRAVHHLAASLEGGAISMPAGRTLRAGAPLIVTYFTDTAALGRPDLELSQVRLHWRVGGADMPTVLVAKRVPATGVVERLPTTLLVPATATGELEYWFELETASGETLWDSNFGGNFKLTVTAPPSGNGEAMPQSWQTQPLAPAVRVG